MTNDEIRAITADYRQELDRYGQILADDMADVHDTMLSIIETLLAREAEVLEYALNNNMMLGSSSLLADLTAILKPQSAALAEEKTKP